MASTITVQNLRGPATGANANKVIIPAGQTFYAPGHVVQVKHYRLGTQRTTSQSWTTITPSAPIVITPTNANSKIYVQFINHIYVEGGVTNTWKGGLVRLLRNGNVIMASSDPTIAGYEEADYVTSSANERYMTYSSRIYMDSPNTTAEITYSIQGASKVASQAVHFNPDNYGVAGDIVLMEIAQ